MTFALLSIASRATDGLLRRVQVACMMRLPEEETAWSLPRKTIRIVSAVSELTDADTPMLFTPTIDQPGDLAYHWIKNGHPFGLILADERQSLPSIEQAAWHEIAECNADPGCDLYDADGYAIEVCDPLQDDPMLVDIGAGDPVLTSPFVTPDWFRLSLLQRWRTRSWTPSERYDSSGLLTQRHQLRTGGYAMKKGGTELRGSGFVGHPARKLHPFSRRIRRRHKR